VPTRRNRRQRNVIDFSRALQSYNIFTLCVRPALHFWGVQAWTLYRINDIK
jgi:hypothetical protein